MSYHTSEVEDWNAFLKLERPGSVQHRLHWVHEPSVMREDGGDEFFVTD